jgi:hypothetical protein
LVIIIAVAASGGDGPAVVNPDPTLPIEDSVGEGTYTNTHGEAVDPPSGEVHHHGDTDEPPYEDTDYYETDYYDTYTYYDTYEDTYYDPVTLAPGETADPNATTRAPSTRPTRPPGATTARVPGTRPPGATTARPATARPGVTTARPVATPAPPTLPPQPGATTSAPSTTQSPATTARVPVENMVYNMQNDRDLGLFAGRHSSQQGTHGMLTSNGGVRVVDTNSSPKTITISERGGTSQGVDFLLSRLPGASYRITISGRVVSSSGGNHTVWLSTNNADSGVLTTRSTPAGSTFSLEHTITNQQMNLHRVSNVQRYRFGGASAQDIVITGIVITEIS